MFDIPFVCINAENCSIMTSSTSIFGHCRLTQKQINKKMLKRWTSQPKPQHTKQNRAEINKKNTQEYYSFTRTIKWLHVFVRWIGRDCVRIVLSKNRFALTGKIFVSIFVLCSTFITCMSLKIVIISWHRTKAGGSCSALKRKLVTANRKRKREKNQCYPDNLLTVAL